MQVSMEVESVDITCDCGNQMSVPKWHVEGGDTILDQIECGCGKKWFIQVDAPQVSLQNPYKEAN